MVCSIKSVLPRMDEGGRDILAEQFAGEFAERLVGRAVTAVVDVVFEVIQQLVGGGVTPGGSRARQRWRMSLSGSSMRGSSWRKSGISRFKIRSRDSSAFSPLNTFRPSSNCASTTPAENKSERLSVIWKSACSGLMKSALPATTSPSWSVRKPARLGDAEIRHLHVALERNHDVLETHVAVDDAQRFAVLVGLGVRVGQPARDAAGDEHGQFLRQLAFPVGELARELLQIHAANQFHADETNAVGLAEMIGLDDVRVDQVGDELGLADEVLDEHLLAGEIRADDFDGHALDEFARAVLLGLDKRCPCRPQKSCGRSRSESRSRW